MSGAVEGRQSLSPHSIFIWTKGNLSVERGIPCRSVLEDANPHKGVWEELGPATEASPIRLAGGDPLEETCL